ncbi:MAG: SEC-C domain-containing protein [Deltaproteobacteria bacterium]|nr:SEC-C domain-containing protein [Deltaproteobacteria bacterium]
MILNIANNTDKLSATLHNNGKTEVYECTLTFCNNPVCTCGVITLDLVRIQDKDDTGKFEPFRVDIDIYNRSIADDSKGKVRQEDLQFAMMFLDQLDDDDYQFLNDIYCDHKHKITEKSLPEEIEAHFEYDEVEDKNLMHVYNGVLPYGDTLTINLNGMRFILLDQYCMKPGCPCTETILDIFAVNESGEHEKALCAFSVQYKKRQWETIESFSPDMNLKTIKTAVEQQMPDIYERLNKRHLRLKSIYAHNKKRDYAPNQKLHIPKVGRNDPCPCGSGKKYKKCCSV